MTDQAIASAAANLSAWSGISPRRRGCGSTTDWLPAGAVRRDRPAASEASGARGGRGSAGAVPPRHRRSGIVAVAGRGHAGRSGVWCSIVPAGVSARRWTIRAAAYRAFVADLLAALLDSLDIDRVDVVGGSIGDVWALSLAEHHPDARRSGRAPRRRADRRRGPRAGASSGCWPRRSARSSSGCRVDRDRLLSILRDSGHAASLEDGRVADELVAWRRRGTTTRAAMRHERDMVRGIVRRVGLAAGLHVRRGPARPDRAADAARLRDRRPDRQHRDLAARSRTALPERRAAGDARAPATMPWFEDAQGVAERVQGFLARSAGDPAPLEAAYAGRSRSAGPM